MPSPLTDRLSVREPLLWLNPGWQPWEQARGTLPLQEADLTRAEAKLQRFGSLLVALFPELREAGGIIESPLIPVPKLAAALTGKSTGEGRWFLKADHALPIAGSIKARGGFFEVLLHAEELALRSGLLDENEDRRALASAPARDFFGQYQVAVGSTGNLGLSIGILSAALGFRATVHMSADAKRWKKDRLRAHGVRVIEHEGDYESAVAAGREQAKADPSIYFVDDESSRRLFLGYSVAALRLAKQLQALGVEVSAGHPLFVYLPCGVGGAPGGITFGLRTVFADHVRCFFAEPTSSPCMLLRLATGRPISVHEIGLDNRTEADGLAVARASEFVAPLMTSLVSGVFTVPDDHLFEDLYRLERTEGLRIEPSAAAAFRGPLHIRRAHQDSSNATHILWTTGGALLPEDEYRRFHERGRASRLSQTAT